MTTRDLNKELLRAVQKQDVEAVRRIIKLNKKLVSGPKNTRIIKEDQLLVAMARAFFDKGITNKQDL